MTVLFSNDLNVLTLWNRQAYLTYQIHESSVRKKQTSFRNPANGMVDVKFSEASAHNVYVRFVSLHVVYFLYNLVNVTPVYQY
jgi:hypothetical protein